MDIDPVKGITSSASDGFDTKKYKEDTWFRHVDFVQRFGSTYVYYRYYAGEKVEEFPVSTNNPSTTYDSSYLSIGYNPKTPVPNNFVKGYIKDWTVGGR